jgi:hypothetical protein
MSLSEAEVQNAWRGFLIDLMFAQNYTLADFNPFGHMAKNPVLERLLPSLLQVKVVAILDHGMRSWLEAKNLEVPKKPYGTDLHGRINYLVDHGHLSDREPLHCIRDTRNDVAHEPGEAVDWAELDRDVRTVHSALSELRMVNAFPQWTIAAERSAMQDGEISGADQTAHYSLRISEGTKTVAEILWAAHLMADDA